MQLIKLNPCRHRVNIHERKLNRMLWIFRNTRSEFQLLTVADFPLSSARLFSHLQNFKGTGNNKILSVGMKNLELSSSGLVIQSSLHPIQCIPNSTPRWPKGNNQWWTSSASTEIYSIPSSISGLLHSRTLRTIQERRDMQSLCFYCCAGKAGWADRLGPGRCSPKSTQSFLLTSMAFTPGPQTEQ